jgi:hypothetical protein
MPLPDTGEADGWRYISQPTAVRHVDRGTQIERLRHTIAPDGDHTTAEDVVLLAAVTTAELEREGAAAGLEPLPARSIDPTADHVGSEVVVLRG